MGYILLMSDLINKSLYLIKVSLLEAWSDSLVPFKSYPQGRCCACISFVYSWKPTLYTTLLPNTETPFYMPSIPHFTSISSRDTPMAGANVISYRAQSYHLAQGHKKHIRHKSPHHFLSQECSLMAVVIMTLQHIFHHLPSSCGVSKAPCEGISRTYKWILGRPCHGGWGF